MMRDLQARTGCLGSLTLDLEIEEWPYTSPFRIAGHARESIEVIVVSLRKDGKVGRGEAAGVRYRNDTVRVMASQIEAHRGTLESGISRNDLQLLMPVGGARNALDCALWDLEAKLFGLPVWESAGLRKPQPLTTTFTCGADEPDAMAARACAYSQARAIKVKLTGEAADAARVQAVREARTDVWLSVDANQSFTRASFEKIVPVLCENQVTLIEQPFPIGQEASMDDVQSPIPIVADESVRSISDVAGVVGRFQMINIKLDKCGGLTEALAMARMARALGLGVMVGNMGNTSLAMAPAFLLGQVCDVVDLDGPALLKSDRTVAVQYVDGQITCPGDLWGMP